MRKVLFLLLSVFWAISIHAKVDTKIDVLFVIDNSKSMVDIRENLMKNIESFFKSFATTKGIDWKLGLISTDKTEAPYLGFEQVFESEVFNPQNPYSFDAVVALFRWAVSHLGTRGSSEEYVFYNVQRVLDLYDGYSKLRFQRKDAHLIVIMISDEEEQSERLGNQYLAQNFFNTLSRYVAKDKVLRFYGALALADLRDCHKIGRRQHGDHYSQSPYEEIIDLSGGFAVSACTANLDMNWGKLAVTSPT